MYSRNVRVTQMIKVYVEGRKAYGMGYRLSDCPHPEHTKERDEWQEGYLSAKSLSETYINSIKEKK